MNPFSREIKSLMIFTLEPASRTASSVFGVSIIVRPTLHSHICQENRGASTFCHARQLRGERVSGLKIAESAGQVKKIESFYAKIIAPDKDLPNNLPILDKEDFLVYIIYEHTPIINMGLVTPP
jgi:hypothetical protein